MVCIFFKLCFYGQRAVPFLLSMLLRKSGGPLADKTGLHTVVCQTEAASPQKSAEHFAPIRGNLLHTASAPH